MRRGKGFVQVVVHHIEAELARLDRAHQRVHVGAVHVHQAAGIVHRLDHVEDCRFKETERARHGDHHAGNAVAQLARANLPQRRQIDIALLIGRQLAHAHAGHGHRGRVCSVSAVGHQDDIALAFAAVDVIPADHEDAGELALRAGGGRKADSLETADLAQPVLQLMHQIQRALGAVRIRQRVQLGEAGQARRVLINLGVVLHRAGAKRIKPLVD